MKKALSLALATLLLSTGCSLISPYTLTFTNTPGSVVEPESSTLDLVVSAPTLAYISKVSCEGADEIELLPIVQDSTAVSTLHKLPLTALKGMPDGALCDVTVTVFDPTTTETASSTISLKMTGEAVVPDEEEETGTDEDETVTEQEEETTPEETSETSVEETVEVQTETPVETPAETPTETPDETNPTETPATTGTDEQGA